MQCIMKMRGLGILEYNDKLANIIDNKKEIKINSEYEVEIRANMLVVIDLIKEKLKNRFFHLCIFGTKGQAPTRHAVGNSLVFRK